jgi:hypothetical protein
MKKQTDYSTGWRHFDVKEIKGDMKPGHLVFSISGNSFGDQIIHYRRYELLKTDKKGWKWFGLVTYHTETNQEGSWIDHDLIKKTAKQMAKATA